MGDPLYLIAYVLLGAVAGMIYALRKIFKLEQTILQMEARILGAIQGRKMKSIARKVKKRKKVASVNLQVKKKGKKKAKKSKKKTTKKKTKKRR